MIWPLIRYHHQTVAWDLPTPAPSAPDREHWLGTDDQARDVLARAIYGFRISVLFGFALTFDQCCDWCECRGRSGILWRMDRSTGTAFY